MEENRLLLSELYTAYFNRAPDAAGLAYWLNELDNGIMDFGSIASNWANEQQEFTDTYGEDADSSVLITQVYANVLGRSPDTAGASYWAAELASGNIPMDQFVLAIVNGAKASTGSSSDAALLNNKAQVGIAMADAGINDLAFAAQVIATVTADSSTVGIVESVITMAAADTAGLANATATLESVQAILADTDSAATLTTTLANLKTVMQNLAEDVTAGTVTNIAATLTAATATVEAATQDASFVANPETLATSIAANPTAVEEDAAAVVEEATTPTTPTTPSTGGGGGGSSTPAPTFTASVDENGTITFSGTATGNITMNGGDSSEGDTQDVTFTRGGVTTSTVTLDANSEISVASGQTYVITAAQANEAVIEGEGTVNITNLEDTLDADLSGITATTVTAAMTGLVGEGSVPQFIGNLGNAALTLTGSADFLNGSPTIGADASFVINASSYIMLSAANASGKTIAGDGQLSLFSMDADTVTTGFTSSLYVTSVISTSTDVSSYTNLASIDYLNPHPDQTVTVTAALLNGKATSGLGNATVTASDSDDTFAIYTTGTNSIAAGLGLDTITLGHNGTDYTGTDTIVVGAAEAAQTETHALTFQDLIAGQSVTVDGLTLTATDAIAAAAVAAGFANLTNAASTEGSTVTNGTWSGAKSTAWTSGTATGAAVTFTSETANTDVTDIVVSSAGTAGTAEVQTVTISNAALVEGSIYTVTVGADTLTTAALGATPDLAALVAALQAATGYADKAYTVAVNGTDLELTWKANGNVTDVAALTATSTTTSTADNAAPTDGTADIAAPTAVSGTPAQGSAGTASDSAPGYGGVAHTIDNIYYFDITTDKLDLAGGSGLLANSTTAYNEHSIVVANGIVDMAAYVTSGGTDGNVLIGELLHILADTTDSVAFATSTGYFVVQGDGVEDGQISDIVVNLVGVTDLTDLSSILV